MSTSTSSSPAFGHSDHAPWRRGGTGRRADWSPANVAVTVIGFMLFWPVGLLLLGWVASGRHVRDLPAAIRDTWASIRGTGRSGHGRAGFGHRSPSDNAVFDDYQQTQYERIREIKAELGERSKRFAEFRERSRRQADQDEFDRFMADAPSTGKE